MFVRFVPFLRTRGTRLLCCAAVAALGLVMTQTLLVAEEDVPRAVRERVELLWIEGRVGAIDEVLANYQDGSFAGRWPILLRDHYWRAGGPLPVDAAVAGLSADAWTRNEAPLAWLLASSLRASSATPSDGEPPRLSWGGGGEAPYPILRALVEDRERREQLGFVGLPEASPLMRLAERLTSEGRGLPAEALTYYTELAMQRVYTGAYEYDPAYAETDRKAEASAVALMERNGMWALWSLLGFILIPLGLGLGFLRRRA